VKTTVKLAALAGCMALVVIGVLLYRREVARRGGGSPRDAMVIAWLNAPGDHPDWAVRAGATCQHAPFQLPTDGMIGYLWGDTFEPGHPHQGIDVFGGGQPGETPVYAAYDGFLLRSADWKSTVAVRIPSDPLQPGRQIWTYYTHLADAAGKSLVAPDFPPGTQDVAVKAGTLLGYQGNYSGQPGSPVGVHLHFSIVLDDGKGNLRNELQKENTLDPSPYFGLELNAGRAGADPITCGEG
jgi:murein DD-endopeptidase MepM/ murein hydrolase activator NlpD